MSERLYTLGPVFQNRIFEARLLLSWRAPQFNIWLAVRSCLSLTARSNSQSNVRILAPTQITEAWLWKWDSKRAQYLQWPWLCVWRVSFSFFFFPSSVPLSPLYVQLNPIPHLLPTILRSKWPFSLFRVWRGQRPLSFGTWKTTLARAAAESTEMFRRWPSVRYHGDDVMVRGICS